MKLTTGLTTLVFFLASLAPASSAFSDESLKDMSRLPHLQRHWLQRLEQVNKRNKVTTSQPPPSPSSSATDASAAAESQEVVEDERVTTTSPTRDADAAGGGLVSSITISEAKEMLKARRIKSRKKTEHEPPSSNPHHEHVGSKEDTFEVKKHIQRMANATCSSPAARLVYVRQQHEAAANVRYVPACTWLHRCSDDTGCCADDSKICSASRTDFISLPFFVLTVTGTETIKRTVTRLTFENHTACECVGRNSDLMPRTEPERPDSRPQSHHRNEDEKKKLIHGAERRHRQSSGTLSRGDGEKREGRVATAYPAHRRTRPQPKSFNSAKCRCPTGYAPNQEKPCVCQCSDRKNSRRHYRCGRLKRGLEIFPRRDRGCIVEKKCGRPSCDYGRYAASVGRCPRRGELSSSWLRLVS